MTSQKNLPAAGGKRTVKIEKVSRKGSGMNAGGSSKSTTANTNENYPNQEDFQNPDSDNEVIGPVQR